MAFCGSSNSTSSPSLSARTLHGTSGDRYRALPIARSGSVGGSPATQLTSTQWHHGCAESVLGHDVQHVALVFGRVGGLTQTVGCAVLDARIVPGGDVLRAKLASLDQQGVELDELVTPNARIGRATAGICPH